MLLTQLEYFVAVAREQHFGRAASASFVSPSTLSEAIRKLEAELGVPLIQRGRTFQGLTREGELVLVWAQRMLADHRSLSSVLAASRGRLAGQVRLGVIPSGVSLAGSILSTLGTRNPLIRASMTTALTSEEIVGLLRSYEIDAGIIHPSAADGDDLLKISIHEDRAVAVVGEGLSVTGLALTGRQLADMPLCLLEPRMRARQLFDAAMRGAGADVEPRIEVDSVEGLLVLVRTGPWCAVIPESAVAHLDPTSGLSILPIIEPEILLPVALARLSDDLVSPLAAAIDDAARLIERA